jgi:hypothetical protein
VVSMRGCEQFGAASEHTVVAVATAVVVAVVS